MIKIPGDYSPPGSSVHGFLQARMENGVGSDSLLQGIFLTQGSNTCRLHCRQILYHLSHQGKPFLHYKCTFLPLHSLLIWKEITTKSPHSMESYALPPEGLSI